MEKWEYSVVEYREGLTNWKTFEDCLDYYGLRGWELVNAMPIPNHYNETLRLMFKRPLKEME